MTSKFSASEWVSRAVDLSAYAGQTIRIRFAFDTIDDARNNFEGWCVDDVNVFTASATPAAPAPAPASAPALRGANTGAAVSPSIWNGLDAAASAVELPGLA